MKKNLASLVVAATLGTQVLFGSFANAEDLKVGDKMPEPRGRKIYGGLGQYIKPKDNVLKPYLGTEIFPYPFFKTLTEFYLRMNSVNPFDFKIKIYYPRSEEIFKIISLISDQKIHGRFNLYASCSDRNEIDKIKEKFAFDPNDSAGLINVPEISCESFMISDRFKKDDKPKTDLVSTLLP